ncbi:MAG: Ig-like domain-containing protein, partial [SAR324 cluster bacterium]|nr:Ig-like domain-containing protein [SAR324 cluster bacterium]
ASDNQTVSGQWNLDNDSLIFWSTGPLLRETNYQLQLRGFVHPQDNLTLYPSQVFHFKTDNQTLNLNNGLIAYYPFDGNTNDASPNGLSGTNTSAIKSTNRFDQLENAYSFGTNSYVNIPHNSLLNLTSNFSLSAWIHPTNPSGQELQGIISKYNSGSANTYTFRLWNGKLNLAGATSPVCNAAVKANQWALATAIIHTNNFANLYLNGSKVCSVTNMGISANTDPLKIGNDYNDLRGFLGRIDEVRIYNRVLSLNEIGALYAVADPNLPRIFSSAPAIGDTGVSVSDNITIFFDKPLDNLTINSSNIELIKSDNISVAGAIYFDQSGNKTLIFDPTSNLNSADNYTLYLSSGVQDLLGNALSPIQISFQTQLLGSGLSSDPYQISSPVSLQKIRDNLSAYYKLTSNINLSGITNWQPIGSSSTPFSGTVAGDNHTIFNLLVNASSNNYSGLFGNMENATIQDLQLDNISIQSLCQQYIGSLVGEMRGTTVKNVQARNIKITGGPNTGGLIGAINTGNASTIERTATDFGKINSSCSSATGGSNVGGLIGAVYENSTITESYAAIEVISNYASTGGLIGGIANKNVTLSNTYSIGTVTNSKQNTGGLVGYTQSTPMIQNSFSKGSVSSDNAPTGGLIGFNPISSNVVSSYWDKSSSNQVNSAGGLSRTTKQLIETVQPNGVINNENSYTNWDETIWNLGTVCDYPILLWQPSPKNCIRFGGNTDNMTDNSSVHTYTDIQIAFNRPVDNSTLNNNTVTLSPPTNIHAASYDNASRTYTLTPASPLDNNTTYTLNLTNGIKDTRGNSFVGETRSFYTLYNAVLGSVGTVRNFTNAGATGRLGPTQAQINTAYLSTNLAGAVTINTQGIQEWTVPTTGTYRIEAYGAQGGTINGYSGGKGVVMKGEIPLNAMEKLRIAVGQQGTGAGNGAGGGGGSYVAKGSALNSATPIIVAGGGGGATSYNSSPLAGDNGTTLESGTNASIIVGDAGKGGNSGSGGKGGRAGGGGGFYSSGTAGVHTAGGGIGFRLGATGGLAGQNASYHDNGGFGGGGAGSWANGYGGGGGG